MRSSFEGARKLQRRSYISPGLHATWHMDGYDKLKPCVSPVYIYMPLAMDLLGGLYG